MSDQLILPAPAKLNLFLHVNARRPDGYHELQTLFQFLDYGDELKYSSLPGPSIRLTTFQGGISSQGGINTADNLVYRAARLLQQHAGCSKGAEIHLHKRIPVGGGLGGGSSDAATTLIALNHLWQTGLTEQQLAELGLQLGADVPVFVFGKAAIAEGVGEKLTPAYPREYWYVVVTPPCQVSTAQVFSAKALTRNTPKMKITPAFKWEDSQTSNDCESVVSCFYPEVAESLAWLRQYGNAMLTGTGSCVFLPLKTQEAARRVIDQLPKDWAGFIAKGMNRSALKVKLCKQLLA